MPATKNGVCLVLRSAPGPVGPYGALWISPVAREVVFHGQGVVLVDGRVAARYHRESDAWSVVIGGPFTDDPFEGEHVTLYDLVHVLPANEVREWVTQLVCAAGRLAPVVGGRFPEIAEEEDAC